MLPPDHATKAETRPSCNPQPMNDLRAEAPSCNVMIPDFIL
jgi:hypothetical protein